MNSLAIRPVRFTLPFLTELIERQRSLALYGLASIALAAVAVAMQAIDPRVLESGVNVWVKPAKFLSSVGIFTLTAAWLFGYIRTERRRSRPMRATVGLILLASTFELVWIIWQGSRGLESHFNEDTTFYALMYALMGIFSVLLVATTLPLAWEIGRRPAAGLSGDFIAALVIGLVLTFALGGGFGIAIAANGGHSVGAEAGAAPLFGWNRSGGDLRIAHFVGIHAEQAIPILAAVAAGVGLTLRARWAVLIAGSLLWAGLAFALYAQAAAGRPLFPL
ncbi:hypothetical protein [Sphingosinicella sp. CPCC 101087]|uniref:hypothetical protein n=1 Tax=Sphingosinicella sp. CPCC 101087 TaxID=2497754 RepID=UPI00101D4A67|nr:hypothetical protein [Sphingosinicella sp. CPCC 101087]